MKFFKKKTAAPHFRRTREKRTIRPYSSISVSSTGNFIRSRGHSRPWCLRPLALKELLGSVRERGVTREETHVNCLLSRGACTNAWDTPFWWKPHKPSLVGNAVVGVGNFISWPFFMLNVGENLCVTSPDFVFEAGSILSIVLPLCVYTHEDPTTFRPLKHSYRPSTVNKKAVELDLLRVRKRLMKWSPAHFFLRRRRRAGGVESSR